MTGRRLLLIGVLAFAGSFIGFLAYAHLVLSMSLQEQTGVLRLPSQLDVVAEATRPVKIELKGMINATVPIDQDIKVPLTGTYDVLAESRSKVPVDFVIKYNGMVPIRGEAFIEGSTDLIVNSRFLPSFPLRIKLPLDFEAPVALSVPVRTVLDVHYKGPVKVVFNQDVTSRLKTTFVTSFPVDRVLDTPLKAVFGMRLKPRVETVPLELIRADLRIPLSAIGLARKTADAN